jgi:hypothetical protein
MFKDVSTLSPQAQALHDAAPMALFTDYKPLFFILGLFLFLTICSLVVGTFGGTYRKYGSKKFLISLAMLFSAAFLTWVGKMAGNNASAIFSVVGCGYGVLNVLGQKNYDPELLESDTLLSRKFIIAILIIAFTTILGCYDDMTGGGLVAPLLVAGGMFGISNNWSKSILGKLSTTGEVANK